MSVLFITVGHNGSGKTALSLRLKDDFPALNIVSGDAFRDFVREQIPYFNDLDYSYPGGKNNDINPVVNEYRSLITKQLLLANQAVYLEASNYTKAIRKNRRQIGDSVAGCTVVFIYCEANEDTINERLQRRGHRWFEHYQNLKKDTFEAPTQDECDLLITYTQNNYDTVKQQVADLLKDL